MGRNPLNDYNFADIEMHTRYSPVKTNLFYPQENNKKIVVYIINQKLLQAARQVQLIYIMKINRC
jgi:hypothetical protein